MNKDYDKRIEEIKKYLEEKNNDEKVNKDNPLFQHEELRKEKQRIKFDDGFEKTLVNLKKAEIDKSLEEIIDKNSKNEVKRSKKTEYNPHKKDNILFCIMMILFPLFTSLFIISTHSTVLIGNPFNYVCLFFSAVTFSMLVASIILKIRHRDLEKSNKKFNIILGITIPIVSIMNVLLVLLFNKIGFWKYMDIVLAHKKLCVILFIGVLFVLGIIFIIRKLLKKRFKDNTRRMLLGLFLTYYVTVFFALIFTLYGPFIAFKEWLITTAMMTLDHQEYCKWFYSEKEIKAVMDKNYIVESGESTDESLIEIKKTVKYKNEYERQILEHEEGEQYKVIKLEVAGMPAYLAAVYDPTSIKVEVTNQLGSMGEYVTKMAERNGALLAVNGGGFMDPGGSSWGGTPTGITISEGEIVTNNEYGLAVDTGGLIGFNQKGTLMLLKNITAREALKRGINNAVSWGPFLIVNGVSSQISGNGGWGIGARTAIGQRADGVVLFLVVDSNASRTLGATMGDLTTIMERYGAINAANLDGGTSSLMALPKKIAKEKFNATCHDYFTRHYCAINDPIDSTGTHQTRYIATSFIVSDKTNSTEPIFETYPY